MLSARKISVLDLGSICLAILAASLTIVASIAVNAALMVAAAVVAGFAATVQIIVSRQNSNLSSDSKSTPPAQTPSKESKA